MLHRLPCGLPSPFCRITAHRANRRTHAEVTLLEGLGRTGPGHARRGHDRHCRARPGGADPVRRHVDSRRSRGCNWNRLGHASGSTPKADTLRVQAIFSGLSGTTTAAHIHCCTAVPFIGNAGVATQTPSFPGFPLGVMAGSFDQTYDTSLIPAISMRAFVNSQRRAQPVAAEAALLDGDAGGPHRTSTSHTSTFGGGEIRARLDVAPAPCQSRRPCCSWVAVWLGSSIGRRRRA